MTIDLSYYSDFHQQMLQVAQQKLKATLDQNPYNIKVLKRLAEIYRQQGLLEQARASYQAILNLDAAHPEALHWVYVLSFEPGTKEHPVLQKDNASFFIKRSLLGEDHEALLLNFVKENTDSFKDIGYFLNDSQEVVDNSVRQTKGLRGCDEIGKSVLAWLEENYDDLCSFFKMSKAALKFAATEITIYTDGGFGLAHKDSSANSLSFLYYFYRQPKRFTGGDLYIYDGDLTKNASNQTYTKATVYSDMLLVFPSHYYHEITPVHCPGHELMDGRMAFVGHIRKQ